MQRYQFIVGVSLAALETELNRIVAKDPCIALRGFTYAQGTGFVAVVEHSEGDKLAGTKPVEGVEEPSRPPGKRRTKSSAPIKGD